MPSDNLTPPQTQVPAENDISKKIRLPREHSGKPHEIARMSHASSVHKHRICLQEIFKFSEEVHPKFKAAAQQMSGMRAHKLPLLTLRHENQWTGPTGFSCSQ